MAWYCIECGNKWTDDAYASIPGFVCYYCGKLRGAEWIKAMKKMIELTKQSSITSPSQIKYQPTILMQMMSNLMKSWHDTMAAILKNLRA